MIRLGELGLLGAAIFMSMTATLAADESVGQETLLVKESTEENGVDACRKALLKDDFPDLIVEKALTSKGIAASQIKEINGKLDEEAKAIPQIYAAEYKVNMQEEPVATNDPLSEVYMAENIDDVRFEVFAKVMKEYVSDPEVVMSMFNEIVAQRNAQLKACGMEKHS